MYSMFVVLHAEHYFLAMHTAMIVVWDADVWRHSTVYFLPLLRAWACMRAMSWDASLLHVIVGLAWRGPAFELENMSV